MPRQVVGVLDPAVARHELGVRAGEVDRCPARDRLVQVEHLLDIEANIQVNSNYLVYR